MGSWKRVETSVPDELHNKREYSVFPAALENSVLWAYETREYLGGESFSRCAFFKEPAVSSCY